MSVPLVQPPSPADRAGLERMAKGKNRAALRARAVLALADGESLAGIARKLSVSRNLVRAAARRFREGGADALLDRAEAAGRIPRLEISIPTELAGKGPNAGPGRPAHTRLRIETWVRDCTALGLFKPGARLPERTWFRDRFKTSLGAVQSAFDSLAAQGFVRSIPGKGSFVSPRLPFEDRYLLILMSLGEEIEGVDAALLAAARRQEKRLGVRWDVEQTLVHVKPHYAEQIEAIASQRYAGVCIRAAIPKHGNRGGPARYATLDHVPICSCLGSHPVDYGSHACHMAIPGPETTERLFAACRAAGRRRPLVVDYTLQAAPARRDTTLRAAATAGLEVDPRRYVQCTFSSPEQTRLILDLALSHPAAEGIDSAVCLMDNLCEPLCEALREHFDALGDGTPWGHGLPARGSGSVTGRQPVPPGKRHDIAVFSAGSFPVTQKPCLPVEWHGEDWDATLDGFVAWCRAIHAGGPVPPPPRVVRQ